MTTKLWLSYSLISLSLQACSAAHKNNVCKNMLDYLSMENNVNCWYNPDVGAGFKEIITRRGYPLESYEIITEDGYVNAMYRIPHNNTNVKKYRQPALLHAGLFGSASHFLMVGNRSLPFYLVNKGYDVWLANRRGTAYSKGHLHYKRQGKKFWDFSFHEVGLYDVKAEVDFVANQTGAAGKIILIGYSMGATETYVYAIHNQEHARKNLAGIISLAPVGYMKYSGGVFAKIARISHFLEVMLRHYDVHVVCNEWELKDDNVFHLNFFTMIMLKYIINVSVGYDPDQIQAEELPILLGLKPVSSSIKSLVHFSQEVNSDGNFQYYDYGPSKNLMLYNSTTPPLYNISKINVPVYIFYGEGDLIANKKDVLRLYDELQVEEKAAIGISQDPEIKFNHFDFTTAKDVTTLLYDVVQELIEEHLRR